LALPETNVSKPESIQWLCHHLTFPYNPKLFRWGTWDQDYDTGLDELIGDFTLYATVLTFMSFLISLSLLAVGVHRPHVFIH